MIDTVGIRAPTATDDTAQGYSVGSKWFDVTTGLAYTSTSVAPGAAVWVESVEVGGFRDLVASYLSTTNPHNTTAIDVGAIPTAEKGATLGVATLNALGKVVQELANPGPGGTTREDLVAQWDVSSLKTNIGAAFVDLYTQTNASGKSVQIDTNGKTQVRLMVLWNKVGTGTQTVQVLEVGTANVLVSLDVVSGQNVSALVAIPAGLVNSVRNYKLQAKSTIAGDDPVFEGARVYLK